MRLVRSLLLLICLASPLRAAEPPDFARDVRPILSRHCFKCHGPDETARKGKLRLDQRTAATAPAKSGAIAIVPGKVSESELVRRILSTDPDELMPPPAAKQELSAAQKDTLRRWVESGAEYKEHWAFIPPVRPPVPAAPAGTHPIDAFLQAKLKAAGLSPAPPADAPTLLRRVSLDLTGLPPSQESAEFVARVEHQDPARFVREFYQPLVDTLLASPDYGERQARKWLDLARYADTNGYEKDRARQIWPYRDWVVAALNADMPFDQFSIEQLAGDMLPNATPQQIIATGLHRNSMLNEEGGIDPLEFRFHAMTDRMAVTGAAWLGLTLQCAQCHTHKFDPIPHREYYSMMAFLNNADEPDYAIRPPDADAQDAERQKKRAALLAALPDQWPAGDIKWETPKPSNATAEGDDLRILDDGSVLFTSPGPARTEAVIHIFTKLPDVKHLKVEALTDDSLPKKGPGRTPHGNFVLSEITVEAVHASLGSKPHKHALTSGESATEQSSFPVSDAIDGKPGTGWAVDVAGGKLNEAKSAVFHFGAPIRLSGEGTGFIVKLSQQHGSHHTMGRVRISLGTDAATAAPRDAMIVAFDAWLKKARAAAAPWTPLAPASAVSNAPLLTVLPDSSVLASGDITKSDTYELTFRTTEKNITAVKLEVLPHDSLPARGPGMAYYEGPKGDFFMGEFQLTSGGAPVKIATSSDSYTKNGFGSNAGSAKAFDGDPQTGWSTSGAEGRANEAVFVLEKPLTPVDGTLSLKMLFGRHYACSLGRFRISLTTAANAQASTLSAEVQALLAEKSVSRDALRTAFLMQAPELAAARKQIEDLEKPAAFQTTLIMRERPAGNPRPTHRHHRGEYTQPEEKIEPAVLSVLNPLPKDAPRDRLTFARWLVSRDHPLTARVIVNRHWAAFFGRGLVRTQEDFGYTGDLPSHPALLDWLAVEFMESGWSVKKLHRLIVTSAAYQQSSRVTGRGAEVDPDNMLLWRGPRHRLEAEQIRDSALAVSGLLSHKMGGPGVYPPQPAGVTTEGTYGAMAWTPSTGEDRYRRSLYTFTKRTAPFAMGTTFDAPTGESCVARRDVSNTPLQSLTLLNDVMFMEAAQSLAKQVAAQPGTVEEKLRIVILRTFARPAADDEIATLTVYFIAQQQRFQRGELDAAKTGGPWALTIRALLNTDEFVTKQ